MQRPLPVHASAGAPPEREGASRVLLLLVVGVAVMKSFRGRVYF